MPIGTPFHSRTSALCASQNWRTWSGYFVASSYDVMHDYEYHAIRNSAGLIDISPLYKYDVRGRDALKLVNRVITRDAAKCAVGQALYGCLCENDGAVIQDGTVFRLDESHFRFHLADPSLRWLKLNAAGLDVSIQEVSERIAALALQGPNALKILQQVVDADVAKLRFFRLTSAKLLDLPVIVSRTGYTGDLGYELWFDAEHAERIWDLLMARGEAYGIKAAGLLALDVARLEAGFILLEVDYIGAEKAMIASQRSTPFEIGLGWTVDLHKDHFIGAEALRSLQRGGPARQVVGLEVGLEDYEYFYTQASLPPQFPLTAWRGCVPIFKDERQVGHATTGAWSPTLKKYIALATVEKEFSEPGTALKMEVLIEYTRRTTGVTVVKTPFFD
ncbi:MAG TPA: aminomethyltransferase family protein, partial [Candidatus Limnocylindrales bacterium]|nr:aminomethyltransferase family protein [Candidatus Limnocylindrales bacterium]